MSLQGAIEARCPSCTELFEAAIWSFVHGGTDIALRDQIKARECNLLLCAHCGKAFMPDVSWIYYEPSAEILAFIFPESWKDEAEKWRLKMKDDMSQMRTVLGTHLPQDLEPEMFFGQEGLGELLDREDWKKDEQDVMEFYAQDLGLSVYKASPSWARSHDAPATYPFKGQGPVSRGALIEGIKMMIAANDRLTAWSEFLERLESDPSEPVPPAAKPVES